MSQRLIHAPETLTKQQMFELVVVAYKTTNDEIRKYAIRMLEDEFSVNVTDGEFIKALPR